MASLAVWSNGCSRHRTQRHGSSLKLVDVTTSLQCSGSFIGCLQSRESTSNWRCWCASLCMASLHWTCQRTVSSLLRWGVGTSCHRTFTHVLCRRHSHRSATGASQQLDRGYGTACRLRPDGKTLLLNIIGGYWRRICWFRLRRLVTFLNNPFRANELYIGHLLWWYFKKYFGT